MILTADERSRIDQCVAGFEAGTGAQIVAAVVDKSDDYPEIPWKAFAFGASATALALWVVELVRPNWPSAQTTLIASVLTLGVGAAFALATLRIRGFARLFLHPARAEAEVRHHAQILFLRRELFATSRRNGLLILVSRFERRVVLLPDTRLQSRLAETEMQRVVDEVTTLLARDMYCDGICRGIAEAAGLLERAGIVAAGGEANELADAVIDEDRDEAR